MKINRRQFLTRVTACGSAMLFNGCRLPINYAGNKRPNFVIILADDLGWGDISSHNCKTPTPNIDRFFKENIELTQFLVGPLCSPTRAGLLTGINPYRISQAPGVDGNLEPTITTFGRAFQANGYRTGIFGKWHNSEAPKFFKYKLPYVNDYGFDRWVGFYGGGIDYFTKVWPNNSQSPCWYHDRKEVNNEREYATDLITRYAIDFVGKNRNNNFVCYLPYNAVHTPLHVKEDCLKRVPKEIVDAAGGKLRSAKEYYVLHNKKVFGDILHKAYMKLTGDTDSDSITGELSNEELAILYSAVLISFDDNIGIFLNALKEMGLEENTVVWFISDNGAVPVWGGNNKPLRDGKHSAWEGGIHTPAAIRWPAGGLKGGRKYDGMLGFLDVYPTCMAMAGLKVPNSDEIDGKNIYPAILSNEKTPVEAYHYVWRSQDVIRTPEWKLFRFAKRVELYNIKEDIEEKNNVAEENSDVVRNLTNELDAYFDKYHIYPGHIPVKNVAAAQQPQGDYLEVTLNAEKLPENKSGFIEIARYLEDKERKIETHSKTSDRIEFDICFTQESDTTGFIISPSIREIPVFREYECVDQYGQLYNSEYSYEKAKGRWIRLSTGFAAFVPHPFIAYPVGLFVFSECPVKLHFYIANLRIVRIDSSIIKYTFAEKPLMKSEPGNIDIDFKTLKS